MNDSVSEYFGLCYQKLHAVILEHKSELKASLNKTKGIPVKTTFPR